MLFLPFENITITTNLNPDEVRERLSNVIEHPKMFRNYGSFGKPPAKPYEGIISGNNFKINRIINYRNSFLPIIEGKICPEVIGSTIRVRMTLHIVVMLFMLFWVGNLLPVGLLSLIAMLAGNKIQPAIVLVPLGMATFGYLLCTICFQIESRIAKKFLEDLFSL